MNVPCKSCAHQYVCLYKDKMNACQRDILRTNFLEPTELKCRHFAPQNGAHSPEDAAEIDRLRSRAENLTLYLDEAIARGPEGLREALEEQFSGMPGYIFKRHKVETEKNQNSENKGGPKGRLGVEDSAESASQTPYPANAEGRLTGEEKGGPKGRLGVEDSAESAPQTPYPANDVNRLTGEKKEG